jgi:hypothetical protein
VPVAFCLLPALVCSSPRPRAGRRFTAMGAERVGRAAGRVAVRQRADDIGRCALNHRESHRSMTVWCSRLRRPRFRCQRTDAARHQPQRQARRDEGGLNCQPPHAPSPRVIDRLAVSTSTIANTRRPDRAHWGPDQGRPRLADPIGAFSQLRVDPTSCRLRKRPWGWMRGRVRAARGRASRDRAHASLHV